MLWSIPIGQCTILSQISPSLYSVADYERLCSSVEINGAGTVRPSIDDYCAYLLRPPGAQWRAQLTPWSCLGFYSPRAIRAGIFRVTVHRAHIPPPMIFPSTKFSRPFSRISLIDEMGCPCPAEGPLAPPNAALTPEERRISASGSHARLRAQPTPSRIVEPGNARGTQRTHKTPVINCPSPR